MKLKQIKDAYEILDNAFYSAMTNYAEQMIALSIAEEKQHRTGDFNQYHTSDTIGAKDAAKLFCIKRVAEYILSEKYPVGADYLHTQKSCFFAAGIAAEFGEKIKADWIAAGFDLSAIANLNYTDFVKVKTN